MVKLFCEISYNRKSVSSHVRQIYTGFCELASKKYLDIKFIYDDWNPEYKTENLVKVRVNGSIEIIYDTNDGLYWIHGSQEDNLEYFKNVILPRCNFLFKRSYNVELSNIADSSDCRVYPLGLNYDVTSDLNIMDDICYTKRNKLRRFIRKNKLLSGVLKKAHKHVFYFQNYEFPPDVYNNYSDSKILFLARLWDPDDKIMELETSCMNRQVKEERRRINESRIECINECKKYFKGRFIGGLLDNAYTRKIAPELIVSSDLTRKTSFLKLIKSSTICIGTTGLHNSIGWKFAEYVAASRAIVTEKLNYIVSGQFMPVQNYLEFATVEELKTQIDLLTNSPSAINDMMWNNYSYYNNYLRPDSLVLNTLRAVFGSK